MKDLNGKVAFITGGASGIGLSMARAFAGMGVKLALADIEAAALQQAKEALEKTGAEVLTLEVDVCDRNAMSDAAHQTEMAFGKTHILCNNAGIGTSGRLDAASENDWNWVLEVNLKGVAHGLQVFLPRINRHGEGGHVVNTASMAGLIAPEGLGVYTATKFAVVGLSESLRMEMEPKNVGVSVLCPGFVKTRIYEGGRNRQERFGGPTPSPIPGLDNPVLSGIDPDLVGQRVVQAVQANELYIITHPEFRPFIEERHQRLIQAFEHAASLQK